MNLSPIIPNIRKKKKPQKQDTLQKFHFRYTNLNKTLNFQSGYLKNPTMRSNMTKYSPKASPKILHSDLKKNHRNYISIDYNRKNLNISDLQTF